jgi:hypothetical protein
VNLRRRTGLKLLGETCDNRIELRADSQNHLKLKEITGRECELAPAASSAADVELTRCGGGKRTFPTCNLPDVRVDLGKYNRAEHE